MKKALLWSVLLAACGGSGHPATDGGVTPGVDGATPPTDSGSSTPADMTVPTGAPSAVKSFQLVNQGGPNNPKTLGSAGTSLTNYQGLSWEAATPGANPVASYNVYRNGTLLANTTDTTYADTTATNSNTPTWTVATTVYTYDVTAVDSKGVEGPHATQFSAWGYLNGVSNWNDGDLSYDGVTANYASTDGAPQSGMYDVAVTTPGHGGWLPTAGPTLCPTWDLEIGAFNYFTIDFNPGNIVDPQGMQLIVQSRLSFGDTSAYVNPLSFFKYGPTPKPNTWATYKVPLSDMHFGVSTFTGSIAGTTLTVTAVENGGFVDGGGYITGKGVPDGTYVSAYSQNASIGTFTIGGPGVTSSLSVASSTLTFQRTNFYKFGIQPNSLGATTMYFDNFGFTSN